MIQGRPKAPDLSDRSMICARIGSEHVFQHVQSRQRRPCPVQKRFDKWSAQQFTVRMTMRDDACDRKAAHHGQAVSWFSEPEASCQGRPRTLIWLGRRLF